MSIRLIFATFGCGLAALWTATAAVAQSDAQFAKANQEYAAGHFKEAIADYESLVQDKQWSANLFYDLGNSYFRVQDFGKAILNYERALALDRHHAEAEANLRVARDEARALQLQESAVERSLHFATPNHCTLAAAVFFWIALFSGAGGLFQRPPAKGLMTLAILSLSISLALAAVINALESGRTGPAVAIVTRPEVNARVATADTANSVLALPPGSEIRLLSKRGDWIYAALPNNLRGWLPAETVEPVRL